MNTTTPKLLDSLRSGVAVSATCGMAGGGMMGAGLALSVLGFAAIFPGIALVVLVSGAVLGAAAGASAGLAGLVGGCVGALLINRPATTCLARPIAAVAGAVAGAVVWIVLLSLSAWEPGLRLHILGVGLFIWAGVLGGWRGAEAAELWPNLPEWRRTFADADLILAQELLPRYQHRFTKSQPTHISAKSTSP